MQTAGPLGASSSAVKLRPSAGPTPSVGRNDALARNPTSCSGSPLPVSAKLSNADTPIDANDVAWALNSWYLGHATAGIAPGNWEPCDRIATSVEES